MQCLNVNLNVLHVIGASRARLVSKRRKAGYGQIMCRAPRMHSVAPVSARTPVMIEIRTQGTLSPWTASCTPKKTGGGVSSKLCLAVRYKNTIQVYFLSVRCIDTVLYSLPHWHNQGLRHGHYKSLPHLVVNAQQKCVCSSCWSLSTLSPWLRVME